MDLITSAMQSPTTSANHNTVLPEHATRPKHIHMSSKLQTALHWTHESTYDGINTMSRTSSAAGSAAPQAVSAAAAAPISPGPPLPAKPKRLLDLLQARRPVPNPTVGSAWAPTARARRP